MYTGEWLIGNKRMPQYISTSHTQEFITTSFQGIIDHCIQFILSFGNPRSTYLKGKTLLQLSCIHLKSHLS